MRKFWLSERFYALVLIAVAYVLSSYGVLPEEIANGLYVILASTTTEWAVYWKNENE